LEFEQQMTFFTPLFPNAQIILLRFSVLLSLQSFRYFVHGNFSANSYLLTCSADQRSLVDKNK